MYANVMRENMCQWRKKMKRKDYIKTAVITIIIMAASIISLYLGTAGAWDAKFLTG